MCWIYCKKNPLITNDAIKHWASKYKTAKQKIKINRHNPLGLYLQSPFLVVKLNKWKVLLVVIHGGCEIITRLQKLRVFNFDFDYYIWCYNVLICKVLNFKNILQPAKLINIGKL